MGGAKGFNLGGTQKVVPCLEGGGAQKVLNRDFPEDKESLLTITPLVLSSQYLVTSLHFCLLKSPDYQISMSIRKLLTSTTQL